MAKWYQKALSFMRHSSSQVSLLHGLKSSKRNYRKEIGDMIDASVVMAPVQWIQRAVPEARFRIIERSKDGKEELYDHELSNLIEKPNPFLSETHLWQATILSFILDGNSYWLKVRNGMDQVVELWYVPHWCIEPKWPLDGSEFISHYNYNPGNGETVQLAVEDVVHFRDGVDPNNLRCGLSCLTGVFREIFVDLEASDFIAALLKNMAVPGVVISPDGSAAPSEQDASAVKDWFRSAFGGANRGEPLVMQGATKVQQYGFNPQQMDLSPTRNVAEERVCASIGVPAAVVGFGAGLQATKVGATMTEMRKLAWTNGVLPILNNFKDEISRSLLPDMKKSSGKAKSKIEAEFDTSEVKALQDDLNTEATRWNTMVSGGWATVAMAKEGMGLEVEESDHIYLRPFSSIEIPAGSAPRVLPVADEAAPKMRKKDDDEDLDREYDEGWPNRRQNPATRAQVRFVDTMLLEERALTDLASRNLNRFFASLGTKAAKAVREQPLIDFGKHAKGDPDKTEYKSDDVLVDLILEAMGLAAEAVRYKSIYERHYLEVGKRVAKASGLVGLATNLPDRVSQTIIAAGGKRAELVDISKQSRKAIFDGLAQGRAEGEGVAQLAKRIKQNVASGRYATAETRSIVIARTETKHAQNVSTLAVGKEAGAERFIIFDGRFGEPRSTPEHIDRDGSIVSADEAAQITADEHPNGTLSLAPHFELEE